MRTHLFATRARIFALAGVAAGAIGLVGMADTSLAALETGAPDLAAFLQGPNQDFIDFDGNFNSLTPLATGDPVGQPLLRFSGGIANLGGPFEVFKDAGVASGQVTNTGIQQLIYSSLPPGNATQGGASTPLNAMQVNLQGASATWNYAARARWSLDNVAAYSLYNADKSIDIKGANTSFCLDDADTATNGGYSSGELGVTPYFEYPGDATATAATNWCGNASAASGAASGAATDTAAWGLSGGDGANPSVYGFDGMWASTTTRNGWIDLKDPSGSGLNIPAGTYTLQNVVNPTGMFTESDQTVGVPPAATSNNVATRSEGVPGPQAQPASATVVPGESATITLPVPAAVYPTMPVKLLPTDLFPYPSYATRLANGYANRGASGTITPIYDIVTGPAHGTLGSVADGDNVFTYTPAPGFTGIDRFTYATRDDHGFHVDTPATVTIDVTSTPTPPGRGPTATPNVLKVESIRLAGRTAKGITLRLVFNTTGVTRVAIQRRVGRRYVYLVPRQTFHTRSVTILVPYTNGRMVVRALVFRGKTRLVTRTFVIPKRPGRHRVKHHTRHHAKHHPVHSRRHH